MIVIATIIVIVAVFTGSERQKQARYTSLELKPERRKSGFFHRAWLQQAWELGGRGCISSLLTV